MLVESKEQGSFSACARKLGKAQSAVSQGISNLEVDMQVQLFDRTSKKPKLTPEGERIYAYAKSVLELTSELDCVVTAIHNEEEAVLRLAFDSVFLNQKMSDILAEFAKRFSSTQLELLSVSSCEVADLIVQGQADLGLFFATLPISRELEYCFIGNKDFCAVRHRDYDLPDNNKVSMMQLSACKQLLLKGTRGESFSQLPQISPDTWWCNSFDAMLKMLEQNLGWAFMPVDMVEEGIQQGRLVRFDIELDDKNLPLPVDLTSPKGQIKGVACQWLFDKLKTLL